MKMVSLYITIVKGFHVLRTLCKLRFLSIHVVGVLIRHRGAQFGAVICNIVSAGARQRYILTEKRVL